MKFIVDAHLPPSLAAALGAAGHDAVHTRDLPAQNQTRDGAINDLSLREQRDRSRSPSRDVRATPQPLEQR